RSPFRGASMNAVSRKALREGWLLPAILGVLAAIAVAAGVWFFLPPTTEVAYAKVLFRDKVGEVFRQPESDADFQSYVREQVAYIKSQMVVNAALDQPKVKETKLVRNTPHPADWLVQHVKVDFLEGPLMLRLSLTLDDPEEARLVVEAITDAYF